MGLPKDKIISRALRERERERCRYDRVALLMKQLHEPYEGLACRRHDSRPDRLTTPVRKGHTRHILWKAMADCLNPYMLVAQVRQHESLKDRPTPSFDR
jgi:hypothetical protein